MQTFIRIIEQFPKREFDATRNGMAVKVANVSLRVRAHFDEFIAEAYDDLAKEIDQNPLDRNLVYFGELRGSVREWENQDHKKMYGNNITLTRIQAV